ncbi:hypothetical protein CVT24_002310 [Panaeolus cyanescens]|uniref:Uncharacterized protein n=1 Tax=Panaeolus cyanescens TaxID=181874 RepID=A0A409YIS8_9AGAR|nr:hypothetical protein CVT24_002310 [Panaeolus cyanescens]
MGLSKIYCWVSRYVKQDASPSTENQTLKSNKQSRYRAISVGARKAKRIFLNVLPGNRNRDESSVIQWDVLSALDDSRLQGSKIRASPPDSTNTQNHVTLVQPTSQDQSEVDPVEPADSTTSDSMPTHSVNDYAQVNESQTDPHAVENDQNNDPNQRRISQDQIEVDNQAHPTVTGPVLESSLLFSPRDTSMNSYHDASESSTRLPYDNDDLNADLEVRSIMQTIKSQPAITSPAQPPANTGPSASSNEADTNIIQSTVLPIIPSGTLQDIFRHAVSMSLVLSRRPSNLSSLSTLPLVALTIESPISTADCLTILSGCTKLKDLKVAIDQTEEWHGQGKLKCASLETLHITAICNGLFDSLFCHLALCGSARHLPVRLSIKWGANIHPSERSNVITQFEKRRFVVECTDN